MILLRAGKVANVVKPSCRLNDEPLLLTQIIVTGKLDAMRYHAPGVNKIMKDKARLSLLLKAARHFLLNSLQLLLVVHTY